MTIQSLHLKLFRWYGQTKPPLLQHSSDHLALIPVAECQDEIVWGEQSLNCIPYQSEWRVKLNNRVVVKDTEQDLTSPPSDHWTRIVETSGNLLRRKIARSRGVGLDDTELALSVNDRFQRDLTRALRALVSVGRWWRSSYWLGPIYTVSARSYDFRFLLIT